MSPLRSTPTASRRARASRFESWDRPRTAWLLPGRCRDPRRRTLLLEVTTRALFPTVLVFSIYLLCVGHYGPGGGFSAGLVAGLAFVLRYLAGGSTDPGALVRVRPPVLIGVGLTIAVLTALAPRRVRRPGALEREVRRVPLRPAGRAGDRHEPVPRRRGVPADRRRGARPAARARVGHRTRHAGGGGADVTPGDLVAAPTVNLVMARDRRRALHRRLLPAAAAVADAGADRRRRARPRHEPAAAARRRPARAGADRRRGPARAVHRPAARRRSRSPPS